MFCVLTDCSRINCVRFAAICFASLSSSYTLNLSPAVGAPSKPNTETGVEGPASLIHDHVHQTLHGFYHGFTC